jgi:hypothetical protein
MLHEVSTASPYLSRVWEYPRHKVCVYGAVKTVHVMVDLEVALYVMLEMAS